MSSAILRQRSLWRSLAAEEWWGSSLFSGLAAGFALGSIDSAIDSGTFSTVVLQPLPDWTSASLEEPFLLDGSLFGLPQSRLVGLDLVVSQPGDSGWLSLWEPDQQQNLLIHLTQLPDSPVPSAAYTFAYPIERLLLSNGADPALITLGNNIVWGEGEPGPAQFAYELTGDAQSPLVNPRLTQLEGELVDAIVLDTDRPQDLSLITLGLSTESSSTLPSPPVDSDVWLTASTSDGTVLWESLLWDTFSAVASADPGPRLAASVVSEPTQLSVYAGVTVKDAFGLSSAPGDTDIALARFSPEGEVIWRRVLGNETNQVLSDLQVTADGTLLVLGQTTSTPNGDGLFGQERLGDGTDVDAFLTAYNPEGTRLWTHQFGSDWNDIPIAMNVQSLADGVDPLTGELVFTDSIVVAGNREPLQSEVETSEAWIQLLQLPDPVTTPVATALLPPPPPALNWAPASVDPTLGLPLLSVSPDHSDRAVVTVNGVASAGVNLSLRLALKDGTELGSASMSVESLDGSWQLPVALEGFTSAQLGEAVVLVEATSEAGLSSDTIVEPVLLTGSGLPGGFPQVLVIDPDGPEGDQDASLLLRQVNRLGSGPITTVNQRILVDYTGTFTNGVSFDSSLNPGRTPFELNLGQGQVIKGWDVGLQGLPLGSSVRLEIPSPLAYGPNDTATIPGGSTLIFDVDLRADLTLPEAFLSQLVWPILFKEDYDLFTQNLLANTGQTLLQLSYQYAFEKGTSDDDQITVVQPSDDWASFLPLMALSGDGIDYLASSDHASILFGEWGDDLLSAQDGLYSFLDGGEGNDRFVTSAVFTWTRGGSGTDALSLGDGNWQFLNELSSGIYAEAPWFELARFEEQQSPELDSQIAQIVYVHGIEQLVLPPSGLIQPLLTLTESSPLTVVVDSTLGLLDNTVDLADLLQLLSQVNGIVELHEISALTGTFSELQALLASESVSGLSAQTIVLEDVEVTAASLLSLLETFSHEIQLPALELLIGTGAERNQVFNVDRLQLGLSDDQAPELMAISSSASIIGPSSRVSFWLEFSEPVVVDPVSGVVPQLMFSNGLVADWVSAEQSSAGVASTLQRFDLVTGESVDEAFGVQPTAVVGYEAFLDRAGNGVIDLEPEALAMGAGLGVGWSLDVDRDGQVTALGDGLMVIRHLFGGAFAGEALINKAIGEGSAYLDDGRVAAAESVAAQIQAGVDAGLLDVDLDGEVSALGDGLMVIRHLFGGAFAGEALISKAISQSSPLLTTTDASERVASHIDALLLVNSGL